MSNPTPIKKRIAPSVPLTLELTDHSGAKFTRNFWLSLDFNAYARIEQKTGLKMLGGGMFTQLSAEVLSAALWAAVLAHHEEYDTIDGKGRPTNDGLEAIRSYIDAGNQDAVFEAVWDAYLISLPKEKADALRKGRDESEKGKDPNAAAPAAALPATDPLPTGSRSGPSPDMTSASMTANSGA